MAVPALANYRRLVVKVGSSLLVDTNGQLNRAWLETLAQDIDALLRQGHEVLIVSSGAIAIGSSLLCIDKRRARLEDLQAVVAETEAACQGLDFNAALDARWTRRLLLLARCNSFTPTRRFSGNTRSLPHKSC